MYQYLKIHSDLMKHQYNCIEVSELQRIVCVWAIFPGLWFVKNIGFETSLGSTAPTWKIKARKFQYLTRGALWGLKNNQPSKYVYRGLTLPLCESGKKFVTFTFLKTKQNKHNKISHNYSKRLNCTRNVKTWTMPSKIKPLNAWRTPK